jgi:hypothetical protein
MPNDENNPCTFLLLQLDLTNHTFWLKGNEQQRHSPKKELAKSLIEKLENCKFNLLCWNGDGGVFISNAEGRQDYDIIVDVVDAIYDLFENWKTKFKNLDTENLDLRVFAGVAPIIIDENPAFCTSFELNKFIKYERDITENGFSISKQVKEKLTAQKKSRFDWNTLNSTKYGPIDVWYDSRHKSNYRIAEENKMHKI